MSASSHLISTNVNAFLDLIAFSEGTLGKGDDGYNVMVGGGLFDNGYADHPRELIALSRLGIRSTAAGRYQLLSKYYDFYKNELRLKDFSPISQDDIAIRQITEKNAIQSIYLGRVEEAIHKCCLVWASFPGNNYNQHQQDIKLLISKYYEFGGK